MVAKTPSGRETTPQNETNPTYKVAVSEGHFIETMLQLSNSIGSLTAKTDRLIDDVKSLRETDIKDLRNELVSVKVRIAYWAGGLALLAIILGLGVPVLLKLLH
jgi:hypothetical protein